MFNKILIANRGEIACRIIRTARKLGIKTVAIYSTIDTESMHVQLADEAYHVGDSPAKASYLNIEAIIEIAKHCKAEAIHPGYGFLSENPSFATACEQAGIIFIGPSVTALQAMASKQLAKQLLEKTDVPLTPGYHGDEQGDEFLLTEAKKIGFPVLLKAAAGGGGKGMKAVEGVQDFFSALASARREAMASFADDTMIIEKLIVNPRHIEVQIIADNFGHVLHLFERDCSIQRRHQKIIEEAPAPGLSDATRDGLAKAACEVARSINYCGAGTIEFLVDGPHYYFMEMNTRLQVEHPVTEMITGLDLVAWQITIAANLPLPLSQKDIIKRGHAIECRIYAEDPLQNFIPSIGTIDYLQEPTGNGIRIDTGITQGSMISQYYDPMIAKLIAHGENREEARQRMQRALEHYYIAGVKTNISYLQIILQEKRFREAQLSTGFLQEEMAKPLAPANPVWIFALCYDYHKQLQHGKDALLKHSFAWQMHLSSSWVWRYIIANDIQEFKILPIDTHQFRVKTDKEEITLRSEYIDGKLIIFAKGKRFSAKVYEHNHQLQFFTEEAILTIERSSWQRKSRGEEHHLSDLTAPMPATITAILKKEGETVKKGEQLIVLEAMKMEHTIRAPQDGIVSEIYYQVGTQVKEGAELLKLS